ncbi:M23 family metallopeptidase [Sinomicrobium sp. M5D2P17]
MAPRIKGLYRALFILLPGILFGQEYVQTPDIRIGYQPEIVIIAGKPTVYYELHITNFSDSPIQFTRLDITEQPDSIPVFSITGDEWQFRHKTAGTAEPLTDNVLPPGGASVIFMEFILPSTIKNKSLIHYFRFIHPGDTQTKPVSFTGPVLEPRETTVILGPPLCGGPWTAIYSPDWARGHRRVFYTERGKARIPGRFAIDFMQTDSKGKLVKGDKDQVKNWYGYGADVLAVADGTVASARDDFSESATISEHPKYPAGKATGNYVSLNISKDRYVFYEHLKPGSIRVRLGQKVKKGEVIASLGFTGQSTGPHLHLHVADTDSPLGAEGLPFLFEHFSLLGQYNVFSRFGKMPWDPAKKDSKQVKYRERPAPNAVIRFH